MSANLRIPGEREEREAWDRYAAVALQVLISQPVTPFESVPSMRELADTAGKWANHLLAVRRATFGTSEREEEEG